MLSHLSNKPPQNRSIFYFLLDFDSSQFELIDNFEDRYTPNTPDGPSAAMIHLSRCLEYKFYYVDKGEPSGWDVKMCVKIRSLNRHIIIREEISRNEFFSQYALGTLEGIFIATRDIEHLREYLRL